MPNTSSVITAAAACAARRNRQNEQKVLEKPSVSPTYVPSWLPQILLSHAFTDEPVDVDKTSHHYHWKNTPSTISSELTTLKPMIKVLVLVMPTGKRWPGWVKNGRVVFPDGDFEDLCNPNLVDPTSDEVRQIMQHIVKVAKRKDDIEEWYATHHSSGVWW